MSLARATERSLVGALLLKPSQLDQVSEWLGATDIEGTAERQTYEAITSLRRIGQEVSPEAVDRQIRDAVPPGTQMADAAYLVSVIQETPDAGRAAVYGRMVLELSIRRHVAENALRLRQYAEEASSTNELNRVFAGVDGLRRGVESLHRRESRAADSHSVAPATDGNLLPLIRFPRSEEAAAERAAVLGLVDRPDCIELVVRWLKPNDFGDEECGALYQEIRALHEQHNPIDRITVAWRATKVGIEGAVTNSLVDGTRDPVTPVDPVETARRVLEQSVKAALIATSEDLERAATDPALNPTTVAYTRLNSLWPQQRRLVKARLTSVYESRPPA